MKDNPLLTGIDAQIKRYRRILFEAVCLIVYLFGLAVATAIMAWAEDDRFEMGVSIFCVACVLFNLWFLRFMLKKRAICRAYRLNALRVEAAETYEEKLFFLKQCLETIERL